MPLPVYIPPWKSGLSDFQGVEIDDIENYEKNFYQAFPSGKKQQLA